MKNIFKLCAISLIFTACAAMASAPKEETPAEHAIGHLTLNAYFSAPVYQEISTDAKGAYVTHSVNERGTHVPLYSCTTRSGKSGEESVCATLTRNALFTHFLVLDNKNSAVLAQYLKQRCNRLEKHSEGQDGQTYLAEFRDQYSAQYEQGKQDKK